MRPIVSCGSPQPTGAKSAPLGTVFAFDRYSRFSASSLRPKGTGWPSVDQYGSVMAAFIFDLDGTLIDTTYAHVMAWQQALYEADISVDGWRIHRRIGMSGGLLLHALSDELDREIMPELAKRLQKRHGELFQKSDCGCRPLRGAVQLLKRLRSLAIPFGIATSGSRP